MVLALLLIVVGAGGAGLLIQKMGNKVGAIELTHSVNQGQQITASDVTEVMVPSDAGFTYVIWGDVSTVTSSVNTAAMNIPAGTLLTPQMVSKGSNVINGRDRVGLSLKDGQYPGDLAPGDTVEVYSTAAQAPPSCSNASRVLAQSATVVSIGNGSSGTGITDVELAVDPQYVDAVVCFTANNDAGIAVQSGNGAG